MIDRIFSPAGRGRARWWLLAASVLILALGAVEDVYGNTDSGDVYGSDGVQYLDIARAIGRHDWKSALNPLWSQGYPMLLAGIRPWFGVGPGGDWNAIRVLNFAIFAANYAAFLYLLAGLMRRERSAPWRAGLIWVGGLGIFVATQICLGQVSRVNPDEIVTGCFFLACGLMVRWLVPDGSAPLEKYGDPSAPLRSGRDDGSLWRGLALGLVLGVGFIAKAVFLALGSGILLLLIVALWMRRRSLLPVVAAAVVFGGIVGSYGVALSGAVGHRTLGESGSINYAWHVNRLAKWVHWEGGNQPASEAWPKPWIARLAQWDTRAPDFGKPIHPSAILQASPLVYGFAAPIHATYVPYYDPPYWYEGYKHLVRPRYQVIAIAKSVGDLVQVLLKQPVFYAMVLALGLLLGSVEARRGIWAWVRGSWWIFAMAGFGVAIYVPVHLEGRYLAGFLAVLAVCGLLAATASSVTPGAGRNDRPVPGAPGLVLVVILLGVAGDLARYQVPVWRNVLHHKSPVNNEEWRVGEAVRAERLAPMSQVGVVAWTANLHCDWAYIADLQITSEVADPAGMDLFWGSAAARERTLETFRRAGAVAVFSHGKPESVNDAGWKRMGETGMWMYRF